MYRSSLDESPSPSLSPFGAGGHYQTRSAVRRQRSPHQRQGGPPSTSSSSDPGFFSTFSATIQTSVPSTVSVARRQPVESEEEGGDFEMPAPKNRKRKARLKNTGVEDADADAKQPASKKPKASLKVDPDDPTGTGDGNCCICMDTPEDPAKINGCEHMFCFGCIEKWSARENSCPLCKNRFSNIRKLSGGPKKKVKKRDQNADLPTSSSAIESFLANLAPPLWSPFGIFLQPGGEGGTTARVVRGSFSIPSSGNPFGQQRRGSRTRRQLTMDDDSAAGLLNFMTHIRSLPPQPFPNPSLRGSYPVPFQDRALGRSAENALTIDDSSDDDDEVEVVEIRNGS